MKFFNSALFNSVLSASLTITTSSAIAAEYEIEQKDKAFSKPSIDIKVGDSIRFLNSDPFFHNVFSLSDASMFDLGSYPQGDSKTITFDKTGVVEVECAIHPDMKMTVNVTQ